MLSMNAGEMARLVQEARAALEAAPAGWAPSERRSLQDGMSIRSWHCQSRGWSFLVAAQFRRADRELAEPIGWPDGTAVKGMTIMHLPPELAQIAYKKARGL